MPRGGAGTGANQSRHRHRSQPAKAQAQEPSTSLDIAKPAEAAPKLGALVHSRVLGQSHSQGMRRRRSQEGAKGKSEGRVCAREE